MLPEVNLQLSGQRFRVVYRMSGTEVEVMERANAVRVEQTIEFPCELAPRSIQEQIVGQIESIQPVGQSRYEVVISYPVETAGTELTQLLNVVFGNCSIMPGVRVERLDFPDHLLAHFRGPRFGIHGLRELLGVVDRPLLCSALKPMGLSGAELADLAYQFALGGIDMIKDDHGLANQAFSPFAERVERCAETVARANRETGGHTLYLPNITGPADQIYRRALLAKQAGCGGLLISPGLTGWDVVRQLADDESLGLPIMSHPAFIGSFVTSPDNGISHYALFGQIARLAGADATVYPNWGGRFSFSREECQQIVRGSTAPMGHLRPIFPTPGGGMTLERVPELFEVYGNDVIFLIGGGLFRHGPDLVENCRHFARLIAK